MPLSRLPIALLASLLSACAAPPAEPPAPVDETPVREELNANFLAENLDVDEFVARFEGESREIAREHAAIVAALELAPGMDVADVGAGTGLFLTALARPIAPRGTLYAVDIAPPFVDHLAERARVEGLANARAVLASERATGLAKRSVDLVLVCDTYHHFTYPRTVLHDLRRALRPGGRLVVVDFEREPGVSRQWVLDHVRAGKEEVRAEIEAAGFVYEEEVRVEGLSENYVVRFRRP